MVFTTISIIITIFGMAFLTYQIHFRKAHLGNYRLAKVRLAYIKKSKPISLYIDENMLNLIYPDSEEHIQYNFNKKKWICLGKSFFTREKDLQFLEEIVPTKSYKPIYFSFSMHILGKDILERIRMEKEKYEFVTVSFKQLPPNEKFAYAYTIAFTMNPMDVNLYSYHEMTIHIHNKEMAALAKLNV